MVWTGPGGSRAVGLVSPGDLGHPAGTCCGKKASTRPCQGPGLIYRVLTLPVQERGQVHQHGLTQSHLCLCCHQTQGLSTLVCSSPFPSQAVAILIPPCMSRILLENSPSSLTSELELLSGYRDCVIFPLCVIFPFLFKGLVCG